MSGGGKPWVALVAVASVLGCSSGHDLVVDLRTDLVPGVEFEVVRTDLLGGGIRSRETEARVDDDFLAGGRIALFPDVQTGSQVIRVTLLDRMRRRVQDEVLIADVTSNIGITVVMSRDCMGVTCPDGTDDPSRTACLGGRCVDPRCSIETPELCGSPECGSASDCTAAAPCAVAQCELGACFYGADAASCAPGQWCNPDVGCQPLPNEAPDGGLDGGVDAGPPRGPIAEYLFDEGSGTTIGDSVSPPLDLVMGPATSWIATGIRVDADTTITHAGSASKVVDACRASGAITFEAWVTPASTSGNGRLFWLGVANVDSSLDFDQSGNQWSVGMETSMGNSVSEFTGSGTISTELTHFVFTRFASGEIAWYIDDDRRVWTGTLGDLSTWATDQTFAISTPLFMADTSFLGDFHYLAIYDRGMPREEVQAHLAAGPP